MVISAKIHANKAKYFQKTEGDQSMGILSEDLV
jgi:hypothetical protein